MSNPLLIDTELRQDAEALQTKVSYAGDNWEGQPYTAVTEEGINLVADKTNGIALSSKFGVTIGGKFSLSMMPDQISMGGGYWRINPLVLSCIPSTTPTPIPMLVKAVPRLLAAAKDVRGSVSGLLANSDVAK